MFNVKTTQDGDKLTIEVDLSQSGRLSKSGKTKVIASTEGNMVVAKTEKAGDITLGLNLYHY